MRCVPLVRRAHYACSICGWPSPAVQTGTHLPKTFSLAEGKCCLGGGLTPTLSSRLSSGQKDIPSLVPRYGAAALPCSYCLTLMCQTQTVCVCVCAVGWSTQHSSNCMAFGRHDTSSCADLLRSGESEGARYTYAVHSLADRKASGLLCSCWGVSTSAFLALFLFRGSQHVCVCVCV